MIRNSFHETARCISSLFEIPIYISLISKLQTILYFSYLRMLHLFRVSLHFSVLFLLYPIITPLSCQKSCSNLLLFVIHLVIVIYEDKDVRINRSCSLTHAFDIY